MYVFEKAGFLMDYLVQDQGKVKLYFGACFVSSFGFHIVFYQRCCSLILKTTQWMDELKMSIDKN